MENEFSLLELRLMQSMILKNSDEDIAVMISKPVSLVSEYTSRFAKERNLITKQVKLDRKKKILKPKIIKEKKVNQEKLERERRRQEKNNNTMHRQQIERERKSKNRLPEFKTKERNYSEMISVKVDGRTSILIKPDEDKEAAIMRYKKSLIKKY